VTTIYLQGAVTSIFVHQTEHNHIKSGAANDDVPFAINCPPCEPFLVRDFGAVYSKDIVPPTDRQVEARERMKEEGNAAVSEAAKALAATATANMRRPTIDSDDIDRRIAAAVAQALSQKPATEG
jgi:hypothetical protein